MIYRNPGTAPFRGALDLAAEGILVFVTDLAAKHEDLTDVSVSRHEAGDGDGWFGFKLERAGRVTYVCMPGVEYALARGTPERGCMHGPRLYVDGNSWWWPFALSTARDALTTAEGRDYAPDPSAAAVDAYANERNTANWRE